MENGIRIGIQRIIAIFAEDQVGASPADVGVIASASIEGVGFAFAFDMVVACQCPRRQICPAPGPPISPMGFLRSQVFPREAESGRRTHRRCDAPTQRQRCLGRIYKSWTSDVFGKHQPPTRACTTDHRLLAFKRRVC